MPLFLLFLFGLFALFSDVFAMRESEFIRKLLAQHKYFEEAQINVDIRALELDSSRKKYQNWKFNMTAEADYNYYEIDKWSDSISSYVKNREEIDKTAGLTAYKRFFNNPSNLTLSVKHGTGHKNVTIYKERLYKEEDDHLDEYKTTYRASWQYPLLRHHYGNSAALKTYHNNTLDLKRQKLLFYEDREDFLTKQLKIYLDWAIAAHSEIVHKDYLTKLGAVVMFDEKDKLILRSAIYKVRKELLGNNSTLQSIKKDLSILLDDDSILNTAPELNWQKRAVLLRSDFETYLRFYSRDLERISLNQSLRNNSINYNKNQSLPKLNLGLSAARGDYRGDYSTTKKSNSATYEINLKFEHPLFGNITAESDLALDIMRLRKLEIDYQDALQNLLIDIQKLDTSLRLSEATLAEHLEFIRISKENAELANTRYQMREINLRDLLDIYVNERDAKLDYAKAVLAYQEDVLNYNNLLDRTIKTPCKSPLSECQFF